MSQQASSDRSRAPRPAHGWGHALLTVLAGLVVMVATAALGLWAAGAAGLPGSGFPRVVAAVVVMAAGGSVELSGNAGDLARTHAEFSVLPLSVTLAGALVIAAGFLRPLRHRAVAGTRELAGWAARVAVLWALVLIGLSVLARASFDISVRNATDAAIADLLGVSPKVGFRADVPLTLVLGLLWLAGILVLALLVSRSARSRAASCASRSRCARRRTRWSRCCSGASSWAWWSHSSSWASGDTRPTPSP